MIDEKSWAEFQDSGMLWWVNRILHTFGWAIVLEVDTDTKNINRAYPARCKFRGFSHDCEEDGFRKVSRFMAENHEVLLAEADE